MSKMPTKTRLMLIHGNTHIPLETVAKEYLNLSPEVARRKANAQSLPWPVISADGNKKSPKFVSVSALAEWLDQIESKAKDEWARVRN